MTQSNHMTQLQHYLTLLNLLLIVLMKELYRIQFLSYTSYKTDKQSVKSRLRADMKNNFYPVLDVKQTSLQSDLGRLTSLIRERESALIMLLQEKRQKSWERPQWLLKQCEYQQKQNRLSRQIRSIILRWLLLIQPENKKEQDLKCIRGFWIKIKMSIKISLEKMKILSLLSYPLFERYEYIIDSINCGYDRAAGIQHYRQVEQMIKNRNKLIHQLLCQKSPSNFQRNKSQYRLKDHCSNFPRNKINKLVPTDRKGELYRIDSKSIRRPLSHQSHNGLRLSSKQFLQSRKLKKIGNLIQKYEDKLEGAMSMRIQVSLDKKKTIQQNIEAMYDQLLEKNMSNHKAISKYLFSHSGKVFRKVPNHKKVKLAPKISNQQNPSRTLKKDVKKDKKLGTKELENFRDRKLGVLAKRAASAKSKRKEITKLKKAIILQTDIKFYRQKKCI